MDRLVLYFIFLVCCSITSLGQGKLRFISKEQSRFKVPFEVSQNLIIVPATINGSEKLKFILDSGITNTIITEMTGIDTVMLNLAREVRIEGLGEGEPILAWYSEGNELSIENPTVKGQGIKGDNMEIYVIPNNSFEFSKQFGIQINGLIGSDFFSDFVVELDFVSKILTFQKREGYNFKRKVKHHVQIPLLIEKRRPYVEVMIFQEDGTSLKVKLLIDTGASMAMWLSAFSGKGIIVPEITYPCLIGQGLNGNIEGLNARIDGIEIGPFRIDNPIVGFPDSVGISGMFKEQNRDGTLGNDILKRFNIIFDYQGNRCFLKANGQFHTPFNYNRSGLEIEKPFINIPLYKVYNVVPDSPADIAGIKIGDQIEIINHIRAININLDQINSILYGTEGKIVKMTVKRDSERIKTKFLLDNRL